jgi:phosphoribosylglycinamide formyltransferase-1
MKVAVLVSGRGSNLHALLKAQGDYEVSRVIADKQAPGLQYAHDFAVPCQVIDVARKAAFEAQLQAALDADPPDLIVLAGFMRILSAAFVDAWAGRIINIHPSLLPEFPGLHGAERQWRAGRGVVGATVHFVDGGVDTGPVLLQGSIEVRGDEGPEGLAQRILNEVEHVIYPRAVRLFVERLTKPVEI